MIIALVGTPGSGKTFFGVKKILDNIKLGKKIYTNIDGLDKPECREAIKTYCNIDDFQLETCLNHLSEDQVLEFWDHCDRESVVVLDEVHKYFSNRDWNSEKNKHFTEWASTHRHEGFDVVLITQDIEKVDKHARSLIEWTYFFRKLNQLGKALETRYICYAYQDDNHKGTPLSKEIKKYDPKVFRCYKSYVADDIQELGIMKHVNLLKHPVFYSIPIVLLGFAWLFSQSSFVEGNLMSVPDEINQTQVSKETASPEISPTQEEQDQYQKDIAVFQKVQGEPTPEQLSVKAPIDTVMKFQMPDGKIVYTNNGYHPEYATFIAIVN